MGEIISKSDRTKKFIVEQTAAIFNEKGYAGTTITDLTNATKLTKGSIYGNFTNKDDVALAASIIILTELSFTFEKKWTTKKIQSIDF